MNFSATQVHGGVITQVQSHQLHIVCDPPPSPHGTV